MNAVMVSCKSDDYLASCTHDGFQEVLGEEHVYDLINVPSFHKGDMNPCSRISGTRRGMHAEWTPAHIDLLVINACILREFSTERLCSVDMQRLRAKSSRVVWLEGWDGANEHHNPPFPCDAYFRRELDPDIAYPYLPHSLLFSAPARWFIQNDDRPFDCFYAGNVSAHEFRWEVLEQLWRTKTRHRSIAGSMGLDFEGYFERMSKFKLAICPLGAGGCFDCMRTWEVIAAGCIPIFVGWPNRVREPWFPEDCYFKSPFPVGLPDIIDRALSTDLTAMRHRLQEHALKWHTTAARARLILEKVGLA